MLFIVAASLVLSFFRGGEDTNSMDFSDVIAAGREGRLDRIEVSGSTVDVHPRGDAQVYHASIGSNTDVTKILQDAGVKVGGSSQDSVRVGYKSASALANWISMAISLVPIVLVWAFLYYGVRNAVSAAIRRASPIETRLSAGMDS